MTVNKYMLKWFKVKHRLTKPKKKTTHTSKRIHPIVLAC